MSELGVCGSKKIPRVRIGNIAQVLEPQRTRLFMSLYSSSGLLASFSYDAPSDISQDVVAHWATVLCGLYISSKRSSVSKVRFYRMKGAISPYPLSGYAKIFGIAWDFSCNSQVLTDSMVIRTRLKKSMRTMLRKNVALLFFPALRIRRSFFLPQKTAKTYHPHAALLGSPMILPEPANRDRFLWPHRET